MKKSENTTKTKENNYADRIVCGIEGPRDKSVYAIKNENGKVNSDEFFSLNAFKLQVQIVIQSQSNNLAVFDLIGVDPSLANSLRRILISEIPTVAIEIVKIWQNTGIIQDEVLSHRLGLIPFVVDPDMIDFRNSNEGHTDQNSLCFSLHIKCTKDDVDDVKQNLPVYAKDFKWIPLSEKQKKQFASCPPHPVNPDILITKLRPGQEIELKVYLEKGIGRTHAKWSPVCTASYRLLSEFKFLKPEGLVGKEAKELKKLCPSSVFDIEESGNAFAKYPRNCTTCRACIERFPDQVELRKIKNHFIFTIESTGCIPAPKLFKMALSVLRQKAEKWKSHLESNAELPS